MVLVKLLDSAVRLQLQAHPTAEFAKAHLNSNSGKAEAYHILGDEEKRRRYDLQYREPFENYMFYEEGVDDDFVSVLRKFSQMGFNAKRTGGCRRKGLGRVRFIDGNNCTVRFL